MLIYCKNVIVRTKCEILLHVLLGECNVMLYFVSFFFICLIVLISLLLLYSFCYYFFLFCTTFVFLWKKNHWDLITNVKTLSCIQKNRRTDRLKQSVPSQLIQDEQTSTNMLGKYAKYLSCHCLHHVWISKARKQKQLMYTNTLVQNAATTLQLRSAQMCVSSARWRVDDVIKTSSGFNETLYFSMELLACLSRRLRHQCHTSLLRAFMTTPVHFFSSPKKDVSPVVTRGMACSKNLLM